jgi:uncharacterized protein (UPF0335 family)
MPDDNSGFEPEALAAIQGTAPKKSLRNAQTAEEKIDGDAAALTQAARDKLKQVIAKIERLEEEKREVADQIKDVYSEAKSMGYDPTALRGVIRWRKQDKQERDERQALLDTYLHAIGELEFYD